VHENPIDHKKHHKVVNINSIVKWKVNKRARGEMQKTRERVFNSRPIYNMPVVFYFSFYSLALKNDLALFVVALFRILFHINV